MDKILSNLGESPLFKLLTDIVMEGPGRVMGAIGRGLSRMGEGIANAMPEGGTLGGFGDWIKGGGQEIAAPQVAQAPTREIQAPTQSLGAHDVDPRDIGQFSAPTFSGLGVTQSQGAGMRFT